MKYTYISVFFCFRTFSLSLSLFFVVVKYIDILLIGPGLYYILSSFLSFLKVGKKIKIRTLKDTNCCLLRNLRKVPKFFFFICQFQGYQFLFIFMAKTREEPKKKRLINYLKAF